MLPSRPEGVVCIESDSDEDPTKFKLVMECQCKCAPTFECCHARYYH